MKYKEGQSDWLNEEIRKIADDTSVYEAFGGKSIPYIGWYWRNINFDADGATIGIYSDDVCGFMPNNKWYYPETTIKGELWDKTKDALVDLVNKPTKEKFEKVHELINESVTQSQIK